MESALHQQEGREPVIVTLVEPDKERGPLGRSFLKTLFPAWDVEWVPSPDRIPENTAAIFILAREPDPHPLPEAGVPVIPLGPGEGNENAIPLNGDPPEVVREAILSKLGWETLAELPLTDRQKAVFRLAGQGYTISEIAARLEIRPKTVETHFENIKNMLDLESNQAVRDRARSFYFYDGTGI